MASAAFHQGHENIDLLGNRLTVDQRTLTPPVKTCEISLLASPKLSNDQSNINGLGGILSNRLHGAVKQPAHDFEYADAIRWAQSHGLEIHVTRKGDVWTCKRAKKRSRITGEVRYAPTLPPVPPKEI